MKTKLINSLEHVQNQYDTFFIDLWGVVHNGIEIFPGAIEVLENLNKLNKRFVLMSNAPRPSKNVKDFLIKLKMEKSLLNNIFTSGQAALESLKKNLHGNRFFHLGPKRDNSLFENFKEHKSELDNADFILCTGFLDGHEDELEYYKNLLKKFTNLKMVCTNPDLVVDRGNRLEYCAGKIAEIFTEVGGEVVYYGKPYPEIYNFCIKKNENILVVGDNIRTDIKGANNMNLNSLFIIDGIHKKEFQDLSPQNYDKILDKYNVKTDYYQKKLKW